MYTLRRMHPLSAFLFFAAVLVLTVLTYDPRWQTVSLVLSLAMALENGGKKAGRFFWKTAVPFALLIALINPLFNHRGTTVLFYFAKNPFTLESVLFGGASGMMMLSAALWFYSYGRIVTSEKFLYLFSPIAPTAAQMLDTALRLIPKLSAQAREVWTVQKQFVPKSKKLLLCKNVLTALLTWVMEDAVDTADSMKARGYGSGKRTSIAHYTFCLSDGLLCAASAVLLIGTVILTAGGFVGYEFFPRLSRHGGWIMGLLAAGYSAVVLAALLGMVTEDVRKRSL